MHKYKVRIAFPDGEVVIKMIEAESKTDADKIIRNELLQYPRNAIDFNITKVK